MVSMKKLFLFQIILFIGFLILLTGCNNIKKSPSETVKSAYMAANAGKYAEANDFLCQKALTLAKALGEEAAWDMATKNRTITKIEILEEKISGQEARVYFRLYFEDGSYRNDEEVLVFENGRWKICY